MTTEPCAPIYNRDPKRFAGREFRRDGVVSVDDTKISLWEEHVDEGAMGIVIKGLVARLRTRGFKMERDPRVAKFYPSLDSCCFWQGHKGDLQVYASSSGRMAEVMFYQELIVENSNGGRYDFQKYRKMSQSMRLQCVVEMAEMADKLFGYGYTWSLVGRRDPLPAEHLAWTIRQLVEQREPHAIAETPRFDEDPGTRDRRLALLESYRGGWSNDKRDAEGWRSDREWMTCKDREGVEVARGEMRYVRHKGRWCRGLVFPCFNNQATVVLGGVLVRCHSRELTLCCDPATRPRRMVPRQATRLHEEILKAVESRDYRRVEALARAARGAVERKILAGPEA